MAPLFSRRFAITTAVALGLSIFAFILGAALAVQVVTAVASFLGVERLTFASQDEMTSELLYARARLGLTGALPFLVAWVAALIHRVKSRTDASATALTVYFAVPLFVAAATTALQLLWRRAATISDHLNSDHLGLSMSVSFPSLVPDASLKYVPLIGLVLWAVVFARARSGAPSLASPASGRGTEQPAQPTSGSE
jgi:hypothetical protein